jgi:hypothetical protein
MGKGTFVDRTRMADLKQEKENRTSRNDMGGYFNRRQSLEVIHEETFSEEAGFQINEKLTSVSLPQLSGQEQMQLADIIECAGLVEKHRRALDENGARFMLFFRQHALRKGRASEIHMSWREINWAFHSISQDILVDFVSRQYHGTVSWENARESGMFMWLADQNAVVRISCPQPTAIEKSLTEAPRGRSLNRLREMSITRARCGIRLTAVSSTWL